MSVARGKALILFFSIAPVVVVGLWNFFTQYSLTSSKALLLLYGLVYAYSAYWISEPYMRRLNFNNLPRPSESSFLLGHVGAVMKDAHGRDAFSKWMDTIPNSGIIYFSGYFYASHNLMLTTPEALQEVLVTKSYDFEKQPSARKLLARIVGYGLITVEGAEHKAQRKSVAPAFSGKQIRDLVPTFWSKAQGLANAIADQLEVPGADVTVNGVTNGGATGIVDLTEWASRATMDIIGMACVGRDFDSIHHSDDEFVQQYRKIVGTGEHSIVAAILTEYLSTMLPIHVARWMPFSRRIREASDGRYRLRPLCRKLVEVKRKDMETESEKHVDILSVLIRSGQFSDDGLVDQLLTFLAAGHDTTSNALLWTCWLIATSADVQDRLRAELRNYFAHDEESAITATSLEALPYLHAVTSEQLRLIPPVPVTSRVVVRDTSILGQHVPKGSYVVLSMWAINRSKALWGPDAEEFKPERWLAEGQRDLGGGKSTLNLLTFLQGPRSCIGQAFSRAELKCLVAAMVMKFEIRMADPSEVVEQGGFLTLKPIGGMKLKLREL